MTDRIGKGAGDCSRFRLAVSGLKVATAKAAFGGLGLNVND